MNNCVFSFPSKVEVCPDLRGRAPKEDSDPAALVTSHRTGSTEKRPTSAGSGRLNKAQHLRCKLAITLSPPLRGAAPLLISELWVPWIPASMKDLFMHLIKQSDAVCRIMYARFSLDYSHFNAAQSGGSRFHCTGSKTY